MSPKSSDSMAYSKKEGGQGPKLPKKIAKATSKLTNELYKHVYVWLLVILSKKCFNEKLNGDAFFKANNIFLDHLDKVGTLCNCICLIWKLIGLN